MSQHVVIDDFISAGDRDYLGFHHADKYSGAGIALGASKSTAPERAVNMNVTIGYYFRTRRYRTKNNEVSALCIYLLPGSHWGGMYPGRDAWLLNNQVLWFV